MRRFLDTIQSLHPPQGSGGRVWSAGARPPDPSAEGFGPQAEASGVRGERSRRKDADTFGGRVDGAVLIRDDLLHARVPTVAFVNKRAISAGALITLAAEKIAMAGGSTVGAATYVVESCS